MTLEEAKFYKKAEINSLYESSVSGTHLYQINDKSINMSGGLELLFKMMVLQDYIADHTLESVTLRDDDTTQIEFTIDEFNDIVKQIRDVGIQTQGKKTYLYDLIDAAETIDDVNNINW